MKKLAIFAVLLLCSTIAYAQTNVALASNGGTASSSLYYASYVPARLIDGSELKSSSTTITTTIPAYAIITFDQNYTINKIRFHSQDFDHNNGNVKDYNIEVNISGVWTPVSDMINGDNGTELTDGIVYSNGTVTGSTLQTWISHTFDPINTNAVRFNINANNPNNFITRTSMQEIEVYDTLESESTIPEVNNKSLQLFVILIVALLIGIAVLKKK